MKPIGWISDDTLTFLEARREGKGFIHPEKATDHPNPVYGSHPAHQRLAAFLPHLRLAIEAARLEGKPELGVLGVKPDGSGRIVARFETDFVDDLEALIAPIEPVDDEAEETARRG